MLNINILKLENMKLIRVYVIFVYSGHPDNEPPNIVLFYFYNDKDTLTLEVNHFLSNNTSTTAFQVWRLYISS